MYVREDKKKQHCEELNKADLIDVSTKNAFGIFSDFRFAFLRIFAHLNWRKCGLKMIKNFNY